MLEQQIVRQHPRISANKLGEYLVSPPLRRRDIIEGQKYPRVFVGAYYEPARAAIVDYLLDNIDRLQLLQRMEKLVHAEHESDYARHRAKGCADAVLRFLEVEPRLDLLGMRPVSLQEHDKLDVDGVDISVYPDLVLRGKDRQGRRTVGAIKLHFPKSHPQTEAASEYVGTLLRIHARDALAKLGRVRQEACIVVDVFRGTIARAPRGYRRRWRDISAACEEIRLAWPSV